jgi:cytochrome P450
MTSADISFDHTSADYARNWRAIYADLRDRCPVARTEAHNGFYVLSRYADVERVVKDDETFSSRHDLEDPESPYRGITIPEPPVRSVPIEMDPPEMTPYRDLFNPWFTPRSAKRWGPFVRDVTTALLDAAGPVGKSDFIHDLLSPVPAILTAKLLGLPLSDWRIYSDASHNVVAYPRGTPESDAAIVDYINMIVKADETAKDRRDNPRDDMISAIVAAEIDGAKVSDQRALEISLVIVGGNDTTTNLLAGALHWLWEHPRERARLAADQALLQPACEEFLRVFAPTQALARTCTRDVEIAGRRLKAGDRVLMAFASANFDPEVFDDPQEVRPDRFPNRHTSFGLGRHRCSGSNLARMVFSVVVEEVLKRMPEYELDTDGCKPYDNIGIVNGWARLPATFTPVEPLGSDFDLGTAVSR